MPLDNQSKNTADGEFSPQATDEDGGTGSGFKAGEIAARALDLPISTSHSPQTTDNAPVPIMSGKRQNLGGADDFNANEEDQEEAEPVKAVIGDFFYNN